MGSLDVMRTRVELAGEWGEDRGATPLPTGLLRARLCRDRGEEVLGKAVESSAAEIADTAGRSCSSSTPSSDVYKSSSSSSSSSSSAEKEEAKEGGGEDVAG